MKKAILFLLLFPFILVSKNNTIDSLRPILRKNNNDTNHIGALNSLAWQLKDSKLDSSIILSNLALKKSKGLNWIKGQAKSENQIGWFMVMLGKADLALEHLNSSLKICDKLMTSADYKNVLAGNSICSSTNSNIGSVHLNLLHHPEKSLSYYNKALEQAKRANDKRIMAVAYSNLSTAYELLGDSKKSIANALQALVKYEEYGDKQLIANSTNTTGIIYFRKGEFDKALPYFLRAQKLALKINEENLLAKSTMNIGNVYNSQAEFAQAIKYYLEALKLFEQQNELNMMAITLSNIGTLYETRDEFDKALFYLFKSTKYAENIGSDDTRMRNYNNIAGVYQGMKKNKKSLEFLNKSLIIAKKQNDIQQVATILANMGVLHFHEKDYANAEICGKEALKLAEEVSDNYLKAIALSNLGNIYYETKKSKLAQNHLLASIEVSKTMGTLDLLNENYASLSNLYVEMGNSKEALEAYKKHINLRDSIYSTEKSKELLRSEMNYEFEKKEAVMKERQEKERLIASEKDRFQKVIIGSVIGGLLLVLVFAAFVFNSLKRTRHQKKLIEQKQKEILDSIYYARRIQRALLTPEKYISRKLNELK